MDIPVIISLPAVIEAFAPVLGRLGYEVEPDPEKGLLLVSVESGDNRAAPFSRPCDLACHLGLLIISHDERCDVEMALDRELDLDRELATAKA